MKFLILLVGAVFVSATNDVKTIDPSILKPWLFINKPGFNIASNSDSYETAHINSHGNSHENTHGNSKESSQSHEHSHESSKSHDSSEQNNSDDRKSTKRPRSTTTTERIRTTTKRHHIWDFETDNHHYDTMKHILHCKHEAEEHNVITADGCILKIHRIPCKENCKKKVVLLMGDYMTSSLFWVLSGPKHGLAFYLVALGYDVWLGNNRGSKYGHNGLVIKSTDPAFWYHSYHEWGAFDLPAIIDFILAKTECKKLSLIGWGYGATQFFVMASLKPKYVKKIHSFQALAPKVYMKHTKSKLYVAAQQLHKNELCKIVGDTVIIPHHKLLKLAGQEECISVAKNQKNCHHLHPLMMNDYHCDVKGYPDLLDHPKVRGSVRFLLHSLQSMKHGFRYYDHGKAANLYFYGTECPPKYNLLAANVPVALYYSESDSDATTHDVLHLAKKLPNLVRIHQIDADKNFSHLDFVTSKKGHDTYYKCVKEVLEKHH